MYLFSKFIIALICQLALLWQCSSIEMDSQKTSITDYDDYRNFCRKASEDDLLFESFKRDSNLITVMQHVSCEEGTLFLLDIIHHYPHLLPLLNQFKMNDLIGNPMTYEYGSFGSFSPTNLRYIKIAGEIEKYFSNRAISTIFEIGGGYGGQCKIICDLMKPKKYTIVDLPEPLALAKRHSSILGLNQVDFVTMEEIDPSTSYDLVISNYAFSECCFEIQQMYLEKIIKNSKAGYMTCNVSPQIGDERPFEMYELVSLLYDYGFSIEIQHESPLTASDNYLIIWKKPNTNSIEETIAMNFSSQI